MEVLLALEKGSSKRLSAVINQFIMFKLIKKIAAIAKQDSIYIYEATYDIFHIYIYIYSTIYRHVFRCFIYRISSIKLPGRLLQNI